MARLLTPVALCGFALYWLGFLFGWFDPVGHRSELARLATSGCAVFGPGVLLGVVVGRTWALAACAVFPVATLFAPHCIVSGDSIECYSVAPADLSWFIGVSVVTIAAGLCARRGASALVRSRPSTV